MNRNNLSLSNLSAGICKAELNVYQRDASSACSSYKHWLIVLDTKEKVLPSDL